MTVHTDFQSYYAQRAATYDEIYARPERQADLARLHARVRELFAGLRVLEVACGTGYWTTDIAATAAHVLATDLNPDVLAMARARALPAEKVDFALANAFALDTAGDFNSAFAGFWWSHVGREKQMAFLTQLRGQLAPQSQIVFIDNIYVEGRSTPIARTDAEGNTYQIRRLPNGERHEIMKNFPTDSTLRKRLGGHLKDIRIERVEHYWLLSGRFK